MARCCPADQLYFRLRGGQRRRSQVSTRPVDASVASDMVPSTTGAMGEQNPSSDADAEVDAGRMEGCTSACQPLSECAEVGCQTGDAQAVAVACVEYCANGGMLEYGPMNTDGECGRILRAASRQSAKISLACRPVRYLRCLNVNPFPSTLQIVLLRVKHALQPQRSAEGLDGTISSLCNDWIDGGRFSKEQLQRTLLGRDCRDDAVVAALNYLTVAGPDPDSGTLARFCRDGPAISGDVCIRACEVLEACIDEDASAAAGGQLRERAVCHYRCGVRGGPSEDYWVCIQMASAEAVGAPVDPTACGIALSCTP